MHSELADIERPDVHDRLPTTPGNRIVVELKGGPIKWLAIDSQSSNIRERELAVLAWQATYGGRVGIVIELPEGFERLELHEDGAFTPVGDPRPARYIVYQRIDDRGEVVLRLRYFALAKFHYAQVPGADRSASLRQSAQPSG